MTMGLLSDENQGQIKNVKGFQHGFGGGSGGGSFRIACELSRQGYLAFGQALTGGAFQ
jgi:hypothetical protein